MARRVQSWGPERGGGYFLPEQHKRGRLVVLITCEIVESCKHDHHEFKERVHYLIGGRKLLNSKPRAHAQIESTLLSHL